MVEMVTMEVDTINRAITGCLASNDLVRDVYPYLGDPTHYDNLRDAIKEASFVVTMLESEMADALKKSSAPMFDTGSELAFYKGLHKQQAETITRLQGEVEEAKSGWAGTSMELVAYRALLEGSRRANDGMRAMRDEAIVRATHAEEELAGANWLTSTCTGSATDSGIGKRAEDNLRCCEMRDAQIEALEGELAEVKADRERIRNAALEACDWHNDRADRAEMGHALALQELAVNRPAIKAAESACQYHEKRANALHDALSLAEAQCRDMEERATNAEYNAKHYWRELQAQENKNRSLTQQLAFERRRYDEATRMLDVQVAAPRKVHDLDDPADCECKEVWRVTYTNTALGLTGTSTGSASDGIGKG
jgi:hypothetical protein